MVRLTRRKNSKRKRPRKTNHRGGNNSLMTVYLMCYNEERIISFTVNYYKRQFPNCKIVICDNESSDKSVDIAKSLGCEIHSYNTNGAFSEETLVKTRNTIWKTATTPWVIVCDMDELLTANQKDIEKEESLGTTILKTKGYEIYGDSQKEDLSDIKDRLDKIVKGEYSTYYCKKICFNRIKIRDINFGAGSHSAEPQGDIKYSEKEYLLYHYKKLGYNYYKYTHDRVYARVKYSRDNKIAVGTHYTNDENKMRTEMSMDNKQIETIPALESYYIK